MRLLPSILTLSTVWLIGCSDELDRPDLVPVSGVVKIDGKPLENIMVGFFDAETEGKNSVNTGYGIAYTDSYGKFVIKDIYGNEGIYAGTYKVIFTRHVGRDGKSIGPGNKVGEGDQRSARNMLPPRYSTKRGTPETVVVPADGLDGHTFNITGK